MYDLNSFQQAGIEVHKCAVCNGGLNILTNIDGETSFIHRRSWVKYDHAVEAVPGLPDVMKCDFCGSSDDPLTWALIGSEILLPIVGGMQDYGGTWGSCSRCAELLELGDLEAILDRNERFYPDFDQLTDEQRKHGRLSTVALWLRYLETVTEIRRIGEKRKPARLTPHLLPKVQAGLLKFWNLPTLAEQILHHRDWDQSLPGFVADSDDTVLFYPVDVPITATMWQRHVSHLTQGIWKADLYWISAAFTQLAIMAGHDFDVLTLNYEELPSDNGLVVWENPIGEETTASGQVCAQFRAATWTLCPGGVWIALYVQGDDADRDVDPAAMRQQMGYLLSPNMGTLLIFGEELRLRELPADGEATGDGLAFLRTLLATLFLINQPGVAELHSAPVDKREARKYARNHGRPQPDVKLVNLRKQPTRSQPDRDIGPRGPIDYRVYRRGHWKQQPYGPKRGLRRHIYVNGYVAGPDGAPLRPVRREVKILK